MTRVLLVDDHDENLLYLSTLLRACGCEVDEAHHGAEALTLARQSPPDLVVSDLLMPVMDGFTLLRVWKADARLSLAPFIVYTATYTDPEDQRLALDLGADEFIVKPAEPEPFWASVVEVLERVKKATPTVPRQPGIAADAARDAYSRALVRKLESKMQQLEDANRRLAIDIADRIRAEEALRQLSEALEGRVRERTAELAAANAELEAFAYSVSHDLRAPLRAIDGYSGILMEDHAPALGDEGRRLCEVIRERAEKMAVMIDELLELSRVGRVELDPVVVESAAMVRAVYEELTSPEQRARTRLELGELPSVHADPRLLRHVWVNLLDNALKFSSTREAPVIAVQGRREGDDIVFSVHDNGVGFDGAYSAGLFEPFRRLHNDDAFPGTGVGLSIARRIVARHGGRIWAEADVDLGATFFVALPAGGPKPAADAAGSPAA